MKKKSYVGRLISLKYRDRKTPIYGFVVDYNDDWTLMKYNPGDYVIDGYTILRHKNLEGSHVSAEERFREKVIKLKGLDRGKQPRVPLNDLGTILKYLTDKYGLFLIYTKSETACYVGRLKSIDEKKLVIDYMDPKGKWDGVITFKPDAIRVIEFYTDYLNSLKLVAGHKKR